MRPLRSKSLSIETKTTKVTQLPKESASSVRTGGAMSMNPCPLMSDEKLETQNGIRKSLKVCHRSGDFGLEPLTLRSRAKPITILMPRELSQILGDGSK
ncbi:MAG TPA: hypothetical protein VES38_09365 [Methylotenera sp.]|nr:hypothetical protein [Methylotenera sp.]